MKPYLYKKIQESSSVLVLIIFSFIISSTAANGLATTSINKTTIEKQTTLVITKDTSLEELQDIKSKMKNRGLEFNYSNVVYNDKKEITSISISYKDANNNSGNYSVASQAPINDIIIISDATHISVKSEGSGNQASINQKNINDTSEDNLRTREAHKAEMEKRRSEMEERMSDRMQKMRERQTQQRARMEQKRESIRGNHRISNAVGFTGDYNIITKNTTDAELLALEKTYKAENIRFSYKELNRNSTDLITHISITINNGQGSISTSSFGNGKDPIKKISIGVDSEHTIMKSVE